MNLLEPFNQQVIDNPSNIALISDGKRVTFGEVSRRSNNLAVHFLDQGIRKGDKVLVFQGVGIPLYITLLALFRIGAVAVFPEPAAGLKGVRSATKAVYIKGFVGNLKARLIKRVVPALNAIPIDLSTRVSAQYDREIVEDLSQSHPALITFTSGSTGSPKGISRSHYFLLRQHQMISQVLQPRTGQVDLISLPIFVLSNLANGVTSILPDGDLRKPAQIDSKKLIKQIKTYQADCILAPPALCQNLAESGESLQDISKIFTGGGPVFPDLLEKLRSLAPAAEIVSVYGSTESEPIAHIALSEISTKDFEAMQEGGGLISGWPVKDIKLKIIDDEIIVTGDHVVKGYIDERDDASTKIQIEGEVWHRTGDAGKLDEKGRLWLLGRLEARQNGYYPFCVETAARAMPGVQQAALVSHDNSSYLALETNSHWSETIQQHIEKNFPGVVTVSVSRIPLDKRHNSKVDYGQLRRVLKKHLA